VSGSSTGTHIFRPWTPKNSNPATQTYHAGEGTIRCPNYTIILRLIVTSVSLWRPRDLNPCLTLNKSAYQFRDKHSDDQFRHNIFGLTVYNTRRVIFKVVTLVGDSHHLSTT
jgi:hypothetical protein